MKSKIKTKTKMKINMNFRFCFHFVFHFCFCFCFLKVFAFLLTPRGLEVPQTVKCLLIGLEVAQHFRLRIFHVVQRCHRWLTLLISLELSQHLEIRHIAYFEYAEFNDAVHFFRFWSEIPFSEKFGLKNENRQFKVKLDTQTNLNLDTQTNLNMQNSLMMFTFFVFDRKYPFWANLVQKMKIVSLR